MFDYAYQWLMYGDTDAEGRRMSRVTPSIMRKKQPMRRELDWPRKCCTRSRREVGSTSDGD